MECNIPGCGPKVSIGMPVFNGENYIQQALDSILAQTFCDFELIICDNASVDSTEVICRRYAWHDDRIRYYRNERNFGANPNYNRTFELAGGAYFKWAAHDDVLAPDYLEKCVRALDADPDAILCQSLVHVIDERGRKLAVYDRGLAETEAAQRSRRFGAMVLTPHPCMQIFGLMRAECLARTRVFNSAYSGCDNALLAELALLGPFITVAEPLFMNREHGERYVRAVLPFEQAAWHDSTKARRANFPFWQLIRDYWRAVHRHVENPADRLRCYGHLLHWWVVQWNAVRVLLDLIAAADPRLHTLVVKIKKRLFGRGKFFPGSTSPNANGESARIETDE